MRNNLLLFGVSLLLCLALAEGLTRAVVELNPIAFQAVFKSQSAPTLVPLRWDSAIGWMPIANATGTARTTCYTTPFSTNELGFHDASLPKTLHGGIAILGDSFVRAEQVPVGQTLAARLRDATHLPVASFGNNTLGTWGELELYRQHIRDLHPSVVVLLFFVGNDLVENNCAFDTASRCGRLTSTTTLVYDPTEPKTRSQLSKTFDKYCYTCQVVAFVSSRYDILIKDNVPPFLYSLIGSRTKDSWSLTRTALAQLRAEIESNDGELLVGIVPTGSSFQTSPAAEHKVASILTELGIPTIPLRDAFATYADTYHLPPPYFAFSCDRHWNPLGHYVAAQEIAKHIHSQIPASEFKDGNSPPLKSPFEILGEESYAQIFLSGGMYTPASEK